MSDERQHAEAVAAGWVAMEFARVTAKERAKVKTLADLIQRERADLLARAEALRDCGQGAVCRTPPGCLRHWEERNVELVRAAAELRAKLAKAEADAARERCAYLTVVDAVTRESLGPADAAAQARATRETAADVLGRLVVARAHLAEVTERAEKAEAAAGQMRAALEFERGLCIEGSAKANRIDGVLATDAGRGYQSPEQVAQERETARRSALEEAARAQCYRCASGKSHLAALTDGRWEHHYDGDVVAVCSAGPVHTLRAAGGGS